jgi:2-deoxy-D-gluconate 3-dehydrogenase
MKDLASMFDLTGRVAIVTGGAGLLGIEFCKILMDAGANIVLADIDQEAAQTVVASLKDRQLSAEKNTGVNVPKVVSVQVDITSPDSVQRMVTKGLDEFGKIDILVNSAALDPKFDSMHREETIINKTHGEISDLQSVTFEEYPIDLWKQAIDVNLTGMFLCCQAVVKPMLEKDKGVIINLCSIYGLVGPDQRIYQKPGEIKRYKPIHYSVTKSAVLGLTRYLATYYAGKGIRVNALTPGGVFNDHDEEFLQAYSARSVVGRMAEKNEMNGALLFLASDASSYMTGANLVVDGGWTAW